MNGAKSANLILPGEVTEEESRVLGRTHNIKTEWLTSRLVPWFYSETPNPKVWICYLTETGLWGYWLKSDRVGRPDRDKRNYARAVCQHLNAQYNFGGAWIVAWMDERWDKFYLLWKDSDGDIQIPIECELGWRKIREWPIKDWGHQAQGAFDKWALAMAAMDLTPQNTVKRAQGQTTPERA